MCVCVCNVYANNLLISNYPLQIRTKHMEILTHGECFKQGQADLVFLLHVEKNNNLGTLIKMQLDMFQYASLKYTTCRTACDPCSVNITKLLMKSEFCVRPKREHKFSFKTIKY